MTIKELNRQLGNMDLYLLDQVLKGLYPPGVRILDAGCGEGRNSIYFLNNGYDIHGVDVNEDAIRMIRFIAKSNRQDPERFRVANVAELPYPDDHFESVISSAVLHFCRDREEFIECISEAARVLRPGGNLFLRMNSNLGIENMVTEAEGGQMINPDGTIRFALTGKLLNEIMDLFHFEFIEPFKSVLVDGKRSMAVAVLQKI